MEIHVGKGYSWVRQANCADAETALFFPDEMPAGVPHALDYCRHCPVREACLEAALVEERGMGGHRFGIRGGMLPKQRDQLVEARRRNAKAEAGWERGRLFRPVDEDLLQQLGL